MSFPNEMFYVPGSMNIIDYAIMRDGVLYGMSRQRARDAKVIA